MIEGAPSLAPTRRSPRRARPSQVWAPLLAVAGLAGALLVASFPALDGARVSGATSVARGLATLDTLLVHAGFGIDQISVAGHRFTLDGDILDALKLAGARTWRSFDADAARTRIEQLPWIATASLTRVYPGQLEVRISERKAFAVWQHGHRATLIDVTGRALSDIRPGSEAGAGSSLRRFKGLGADSEAASLAATVDRHPGLAARLVLAERVAERRWTLHLDNGTSIVLPPDREAQALAALLSSPRIGKLLETGGQIVDLRSSGRIAVRPAAPPRAGLGKLAEGAP